MNRTLLVRTGKLPDVSSRRATFLNATWRRDHRYLFPSWTANTSRDLAEWLDEKQRMCLQFPNYSAQQQKHYP